MIRSPRGKLVQGLGVALLALPFVFALTRAAVTTTDYRFLWMALAAFASAGAIMRLGRARGTSAQGIGLLFVVSVVVAAVAGRLVGAITGARSAEAIWFVALGFALCEAGGFSLQALSRTRAMGAEWRDASQPR